MNDSFDGPRAAGTVPPPAQELPPRLRRAIELVYALEGVVGVRVWQWAGHVALGIATAPAGDREALRRVEAVTTSLREPGETWELGLLDDGTAEPDATDVPE